MLSDPFAWPLDPWSATDTAGIVRAEAHRVARRGEHLARQSDRALVSPHNSHRDAPGRKKAKGGDNARKIRTGPPDHNPTV